MVELTWKGKYDEHGKRAAPLRIQLPFQTVETVNESAQERQMALDGALWFGTWEGISRFDGEAWTTFTTNDGLVSNGVQSIAVAPDGALWFGTFGGVSRYLPPD